MDALYDNDFDFSEKSFTTLFDILSKHDFTDTFVTELYEDYRFNSDHINRTGFNGTESLLDEYDVTKENEASIIKTIVESCKDWKYRQISIEANASRKDGVLYTLFFEMYGGVYLSPATEDGKKAETIEDLEKTITKIDCSICSTKRNVNYCTNGICDYCKAKQDIAEEEALVKRMADDMFISKEEELIKKIAPFFGPSKMEDTSYSANDEV